MTPDPVTTTDRWPVVFLIDELLASGGTEVHLVFLARRFRELGHPVEVWTLKASGWISCFYEIDVRVRVFDDLPGVFRPWVALSVRRLTRALDEFAPTGPVIVQAYHTASDFLAALLRKANPRVRSISSWRDMGIFRSPAHILMQRTVAKHVDRLLVVSEAVRVAAAARTGVPAAYIGVVHNGVDCVKFRPPTPEEKLEARQRLGLQPDEVVGFTVGSFHSFKGQDLVLEACATLAQEGLRLRPVFAGDGALLADHKALAARLGLDSALFLGSRKDIAELLWAADVFVLASWSEGFSNAIIEAMASGLPIVSTTVGGNPQAVTRDCGTLIPPGDLERLVTALRPLIESERLRRSMGANGRKRVSEVFHLDAMVEDYRDVHRELLRG